jgi:translation initiation factor 1
MTAKKSSVPFNNPFAVLKKPGHQPQEPAPPSVPQRAVLRYERKGHGGKEVTAIELPGLEPAAIDDWLRDLKTALGCGGTVRADAILLQGDQRERVRAWLAARGVRKVSG